MIALSTVKGFAEEIKSEVTVCCKSDKVEFLSTSSLVTGRPIYIPLNPALKLQAFIFLV